jgi:hypothetical protein
MKKLLGIIVLGLLWCNLSLADDLKGKKLFCTNTGKYMSFEFKFFSRVKFIDIDPWAGDNYMDKESYDSGTIKYEVEPGRILLKYKNWRGLYIDRKTLKIHPSTSYSCELVPEHIDLDKKMKNIYNNLVKSIDSENKI